MVKRLVRALMTGAECIVFGILALPFLIFFAPVLLIAAGWHKLELWAFYDGDEEKRQRDQWRHT